MTLNEFFAACYGIAVGVVIGVMVACRIADYLDRRKSK